MFPKRQQENDLKLNKLKRENDKTFSQQIVFLPLMTWGQRKELCRAVQCNVIKTNTMNLNKGKTELSEGPLKNF